MTSPHQPPFCCAVTELAGWSTTPIHQIRASTWFWRSASRFVPLACIWNGLLSVFLWVAAAGFYQQLVGPLPDWMPPVDGGEDLDSLGDLGFLLMFLSPFLVIGSVLGYLACLSTFGRVTVRIEGHQWSVRTGVGPIGRTLRADAAKVTDIQIGKSRWKSDDKPIHLIQIDADRPLRFARVMHPRRRQWLLETLRSHRFELESPAEVAEPIQRAA